MILMLPRMFAAVEEIRNITHTDFRLPKQVTEIIQSPRKVRKCCRVTLIFTIIPFW